MAPARCTLRVRRGAAANESPAIGYLVLARLPLTRPVEAFQQGLRELVRGRKNIVVEWRSAEGNRSPPLACAELVRSQGRRHRHDGPYSTRAAQGSNCYDSIVMAAVGDLLATHPSPACAT